MDHNAAANKQIDSMTDKHTEREVAGSGAAVQNLQQNTAVEPAFLVPIKTDMEILQKNFGASRF